MNSPIIALDADGVLLNYHAAYRQTWERAFGVLPCLRDPNAYWPIDRWEVPTLSGEDLNDFRSLFDHDFWSTVPAIDGAVEACHLLADAGYKLVCVSALESEYQQARLENLKMHGFPIDNVIATSSEYTNVSPKANALILLNPKVFIDDFLPYFRGVPSSIHKALIMREPNGSPNHGEELLNIQSKHSDLFDFANWWTSAEQY